MSVAETPTTEPVSRNPQQQLAVASGIGALIALACLWFVFAGLPELWGRGWDEVFKNNPDMLRNVFLSDALLIMLDLLAIGGIAFAAFAAYRLLQQQTQPGLRAGIFFGALYLFAALVAVGWLSNLTRTEFTDPTVGWGILGALLAVLVGLAGYVYVAIPGWMNFLEAVENQGWFHAYAYKGNQGVRVRRGSIVGLLAVGVCGIVTMVTHRFFGTERIDAANDWTWLVPYAQKPDAVVYLPLMFKVHLIMPILVGLLLIWVAWRSVNIPGFADFLIATEAEMNKVSWTNRKRLVQDTIVVLVTVFLFTAFLFIVDVVWIKILSAPGIQVLLIDTRAELQKQNEKAKW